MTNQDRYSPPIADPRLYILLDVKAETDESHEARMMYTNATGAPAPDKLRRYMGIWVSNPVFGTLSLGSSSRADFSEYSVAVAIAEKWAEQLIKDYDHEEISARDLIIHTPQLAELLTLMAGAAQSVDYPQHPQNPNYTINLN